jgi:hypothetical protein
MGRAVGGNSAGDFRSGWFVALAFCKTIAHTSAKYQLGQAVRVAARAFGGAVDHHDLVRSTLHLKLDNKP